MVTVAHKRWSPPVDTSLLFLAGVTIDLSAALDALDLLDQEWSRDSPNPILLQALATAAIISYGRCFATGRRERIDLVRDFVVSQSESQLHDRIIDIRNKHVAHPVNEFETHVLYISYHLEAVDPVATGVATGSMVLASLAIEEINSMRLLCSSLLSQIHLKRVEETKRLLELAVQLSSSEILALPVGLAQASSNSRCLRNDA